MENTLKIRRHCSDKRLPKFKYWILSVKFLRKILRYVIAEMFRIPWNHLLNLFITEILIPYTIFPNALRNKISSFNKMSPKSCWKKKFTSGISILEIESNLNTIKKEQSKTLHDKTNEQTKRLLFAVVTNISSKKKFNLCSLFFLFRNLQ